MREKQGSGLETMERTRSPCLFVIKEKELERKTFGMRRKTKTVKKEKEKNNDEYVGHNSSPNRNVRVSHTC